MEKISYALGLSIGNNLLSSGIAQLDLEKFCQAVADVLGHKTPEMSYDEAKEVLNRFFADLSRQVAEKQQASGRAFLEKNAKEQGVVVLPSGLQYKVLSEGSGRKPGPTDKVRCHYEGSLIDGTVFDSSVKRGEPAEFGVNQVIAGWVEALQLMSEGAKWRLFIPSELAYGAQGAGASVPPHATLVLMLNSLKS